MTTETSSVIKEVPCKSCGDPIPANAKKCRHCQSYQRLLAFGKDSPVFTVVWAVLFIGFMIWQQYSFRDKREPYSKHEGSLIVSTSSII